MVRIIVDSTCDLPEELIEKYDMKLLPQRVYLQGEEYYDRVTLQAEEVYEAMSSGIFPLTSLPSPAWILDIFTQCCREGEDFIFVSISSKFSGTYHMASSLLEELREQYQGIRMEVIDSKSTSLTAGLIAVQGAKLSREGKDFDTIAGQIREMAGHAEHIFTVADLNCLIRGGRLSKTEGVIGSMLKVVPVLHVRDGEAELLERVRGHKKTLMTIMRIAEERIREFPGQTIGIAHAANLEAAYELKEMVRERLGNDKIIMGKIGATLVSHLGLGALGIFFLNKRPELYME